VGLSIFKTQTVLGWLSPVRLAAQEKVFHMSLNTVPLSEVDFPLCLLGRRQSRVVLVFQVVGGLCLAAARITGTPSTLGDTCYSSVGFWSWVITRVYTRLGVALASGRGRVLLPTVWFPPHGEYWRLRVRTTQLGASRRVV